MSLEVAACISGDEASRARRAKFKCKCEVCKSGEELAYLMVV